ncbi:hypothetical protein KGF56_001612 [Candida oxycetoniae]|uniref:Uncharacterized protein n=1 Tax=Candida oxycetoniae TaxID=497107 RepID=A0AAI9SZJ9_9ASCO|nr:uncharacterized protein KGF56_001612 [Candida oxycetoniae]KAI3405594.2 hypothetical protein KGF56_001612 [Candida oxycetoniae]
MAYNTRTKTANGFQFDKLNPSVPFHQQDEEVQHIDDFDNNDDENIFELNIEESTSMSTTTATTSINNYALDVRDLTSTPVTYTRNSSISSLESKKSITDSIFSPIASPLVLPYTYQLQYEDDEENKDDDHLLYECVICKQKTSLSSKHNCSVNLYKEDENNALTAYTKRNLNPNSNSESNCNETIIKSGNQSILNNYRKWLVMSA